MIPARAHGQKVRGHTLVWHNQPLPGLADAAQLEQSPTSIRSTPRQGTSSTRSATSEAASLEPGTWSTRPSTTTAPCATRCGCKIGPGYIADAFRWAHQADPKALLFYNDYNIEGVNAKSDAVYALVQQLRAQGGADRRRRAAVALRHAVRLPGRRPEPALAKFAKPRPRDGRRPRVDVRSILPMDSARSCRPSPRATACCSRAACCSAAASPSPCGASPTSTSGCRGSSPGRARRRSTTRTS